MHENMNSKHKDEEINVKMHKGFNVVRPIMPTSTYEIESFHYS